MTIADDRRSRPDVPSQAPGVLDRLGWLITSGIWGTLSKRQLRVLGVLLCRGGPDGVAWPSAATIAAESAVSRPHVFEVLAELAGLGILERLPDRSRARSVRYRVCPAATTVAWSEAVGMVPKTGTIETPDGPQNGDHDGSRGGDPDGPQNGDPNLPLRDTPPPPPLGRGNLELDPVRVAVRDAGAQIDDHDLGQFIAEGGDVELVEAIAARLRADPSVRHPASCLRSWILKGASACRDRARPADPPPDHCQGVSPALASRYFIGEDEQLTRAEFVERFAAASRTGRYTLEDLAWFGRQGEGAEARERALAFLQEAGEIDPPSKSATATDQARGTAARRSADGRRSLGPTSLIRGGSNA